MAEKIDILVFNSSKLLTLCCEGRPLVGKKMQDLGVIANGAVAIHHGKILETGTSETLLQKYQPEKTIDACGKLVMPGFVDCHTHTVFAGTREYELGMKISGATYLDILKAGGGIHSTVNATRKASEEELCQLASDKLDEMLRHGTTTVEIKSGYGLDYETEKKILKVIKHLKKNHPARIVSTYLGAHTFPKDMTREEYMKLIIEKALPDFKDLTEYCDVFTEEGAFNLSETEAILRKAKELGYKLKIHAGQFNDLGAASLASNLGAISADHLEFVSLKELDIMKKNGTASVLMPGVPFFLMNGKYPDARQMINNENIVALSTDFNPGSCPAYSMQLIIALACYQMKMTPEEAIVASTVNAAYAIDRLDVCGSLEPGKDADIIILNVTEPAHIPYYFGSNLVSKVIKSGKQIEK
ncbi:MAG TPA: imidazolonepropionase [Lentisphaeria bacterium]|nr:MAG: imidazolonepropionase [Lentisphaerae bacterium GWF2_38_69]HBM16804.1 imidazolonepropionase [Lentisphaeria bacterium]